MKKIISIDGGGVRGLIACGTLIAIEEKLPKGKIIADYFDFFAGTSTGGLLVALLLHPNRYTAKQVADLYLKNGSTIFKASWWDKVRYIFQGDKYPVKNINQVLQSYVGDCKMSELAKPCIITSYDITRRQAKFFARHDKVDFFVKDVCRATSAAPTYFAPMQIKDSKGAVYNCIDGGMHSNDPALAAFSEVVNAVDKPRTVDIFILSLGTGLQEKSYDYKQAKNWGAVAWVDPVLDIMMSASAEVTDYHLRMLFKAAGCSKNYIRIQPEIAGLASPEMDCVTAQNLKELARIGARTAFKYHRTIDRVVELLLKDQDKVEFLK